MEIHFYRHVGENNLFLKLTTCEQIELLEMRTEVMLIERTTGTSVKDVGLTAELKAWSMLFTSKYINRTMIGVLMMFFQRELSAYFSSLYCY